jgi:hypothetical protein
MMVRYWHGTSDVFLPRIRREGLRPYTECGVACEDWGAKDREADELDDPLFRQWVLASHGKVFLANNTNDAAIYAHRAVGKFGGHMVILEVELDPSTVTNDEDSSWHYDSRFPEFEYKGGYEANYRLSGSVSYTGTIYPGWIVKIKKVKALPLAEFHSRAGYRHPQVRVRKHRRRA